MRERTNNTKKGQRDDPITEALNEIYGKETSSLDPIIQNLQFGSLPKDEW
jgi:hypothetical protein